MGKLELLGLICLIGFVHCGVPIPVNFNEDELSIYRDATPAGRTISFQPHSVNALDQWPSLWRHGNRHAKLDPHFVDDLDLCRKNMEDHDVLSDGCFLLNHDGPTKDGAYNSTEDLLQYLSHASVQPHLKDPHSRFQIALCFKDESIDPCNTTSVVSRKWVKVMDDFFAKANKLVTNNDLNMEFILDGGGKPHNCTLDKWRPWNSTWILTPEGALTSDDVSKAYDRYRVLNVAGDMDPWKKLAAQKFGKFPGNAQYPLQLWEPDAESDITALADVYINSGVVHKPGFLFAININPTMFELYVSSRTGRVMREADDFGYSGQGGLSGPVVVRPVGSALPIWTLAKAADGTYLVRPARTTRSVSSSRENASFALRLPAGWVGKATISSASQWARNIDQVVVMTTSGWTALCEGLSKGASAPDCIEISRDNPGPSLMGSYFVTEISASDVVRGYAGLCASATWKADGANPCSDGCTVAAVMYSSNGRLLSSTCVSKAKNVVAVSADGHHVTFDDGIAGHFIMVSMSTSDNVILGATAALKKNSWTVAPSLADGRNSPLVNVGNSAVLSIAGPLAGRLDECRFMIVNDNGYCYNSHPHNTQPYPTVCQAPGASTPGVLSYTFGSLENVVASLDPDKKGATTCHPLYTHGAYDLGYKPSVALVYVADNDMASLSLPVGGRPLGNTSNGGFGMMEAHVSMGSHTGDEAQSCGVPNPSGIGAKDGLVVLNSWELPFTS